MLVSKNIKPSTASCFKSQQHMLPRGQIHSSETVTKNIDNYDRENTVKQTSLSCAAPLHDTKSNAL